MSSDRAMKFYAHIEAIERVSKDLPPGHRSVRIAKAMNLVKEGMAAPQVFMRFPGLEGALKDGLEAESVLLMLDLSPFSEVVWGWSPWEIVNFLNRYYRDVVGKIVERGGVVEKYIGDAVIAAFGQPFDNTTTREHLEIAFSLGMLFAEEIAERFDGRVAAKTSIAVGPCFYGYVGHEEHKELTIIGAPLTELFRLESVCPRSSVILERRLFDSLEGGPFTTIDQRVAELLGIEVDWAYAYETFDLRGVGLVEVAIATRQ